MKRIAVYSAMTVVLAACGNGGDFDATGTFEATEVLVSAEAAGRILSFDVEEGDTLSAGKQVGAIDTVQLYLQKLQLERQRASVHSNRPDISKQAAALRGQIAQQETERRRVENLLKDGAATTKQLDDINASLRVLNGQLDALLSTLKNNTSSIDENASAIDLQIAQVEDRLSKCRIVSPIDGSVLVKYSEAGELATTENSHTHKITTRFIIHYFFIRRIIISIFSALRNSKKRFRSAAISPNIGSIIG